MKKPKRSPSRIKYENQHPTISARLPLEQQKKLMALIKSLDITLPQLLLHFIGEYEIKFKLVEEVRQKAFYQGFGEGFRKARERAAIIYPCSICGKEIIVESDAEKEAIREYMQEHGWGHSDCINES